MRVAFVIVLAGCVAPAPGAPVPAATSADVLNECPALPDGAPMACQEPVFVDASPGRPEVTDGWKCASSWAEENVYVESYTTLDGRVGFYWEWERWKDDGLAHQSLAWYEGEGVGEVLHVAYQPRGFISLPAQDPDGAVEIHHMFRQYRVHAMVDGAWVQPDNVTFLVDNVGGDTWWATRFDWPGGPYFVSTMEEDRTDGQMRVWNGGGWRGTIDGTELIIDVKGNGIKYLNVDFTERRTRVDACGAVP